MEAFGDDCDDFNTNSTLWQKTGQKCITKLVESLGSEGSTFQYADNKKQYEIFSNYPEAHYCVPELGFQEKSLEEADQYKNVGNTYFAKGQFDEALGLYKQSIIFAPLGTETLAVSYANRSAVYMKLNKYQLAVDDIEAALKGCYPEDKKEKLLQRQEACLKALGQGPSKSTDDENATENICEGLEEFLHPEIKNSNSEHQALISKVKVEKSDKTGRYLVAAEKINPGEIVLVEQPFVLVQIPSLYRITCHNCSSLIERALPCDTCAKVAFCSQSCKAAATYHQYECKLLDLIFDSGLGKDAYIALRLVTRESPENFVVDIKNGKYSAVLEAESHPEYREMSEEARIVITTKFLLDALIKVGYFEKEEVEVAAVIMQFIRAIRYNKLTIDKFLSEHPEEDIYDVAVGMFPTFNLINHSCDPNVFNYFVKDKVALVAKRQIHPGQEVAFCYGPRFPAMSKDERRKILMDDFRFQCECNVCKNEPDVKIVQDLNLKVFTQRRLFKCPFCQKFSLRIKIGSNDARCQQCGQATNSRQILAKCQDLIKKFEGISTRVGEFTEFNDIPVLLGLTREFDELVGSPSEYGLKAEEMLMYLVRRVGCSVECPKII